MSSATQFQLPPRDGFVVTHFLVVADQDQSRDYYRDVLGAEVLRERDPVIMKLANSWVILNTGGGPPTTSPPSPSQHRKTPTPSAPSSIYAWPTSPGHTASGVHEARNS